MRLWPAVLAVLSLCGASVCRAEPVALTFDDLPTLSLSRDLAYARQTTNELLSRLRRHHFPAIGFVNEGKLEGADKADRVALLRSWLDDGFDLGNHTYGHFSLNRVPLDQFISDTAKGEVVTRSLLEARGRSPHWFRHPYLETGLTLATRKAFEGWLAQHGYRVAPVTMENSDWTFAYPYDEAVLKNDQVGAARIKAEYLTYTAAVMKWYEVAAYTLLGRRPAFVFLLHASRLNADAMDDLASRFREDGLMPVSIETAMRDPAYALPDTYAGPNGDEWLSRWSETLHKGLPWASFPQPPADIVAADDRLDSAP